MSSYRAYFTFCLACGRAGARMTTFSVFIIVADNTRLYDVISVTFYNMGVINTLSPPHAGVGAGARYCTNCTDFIDSSPPHAGVGAHGRITLHYLHLSSWPGGQVMMSHSTSTLSLCKQNRLLGYTVSMGV